jgi:hypothetical protein
VRSFLFFSPRCAGYYSGLYCVLALMVSRHPGVQTEAHRNGRYRPAFPYSQEMQSCRPSQKNVAHKRESAKNALTGQMVPC